MVRQGVGGGGVCARVHLLRGKTATLSSTSLPTLHAPSCIQSRTRICTMHTISLWSGPKTPQLPHSPPHNATPHATIRRQARFPKHPDKWCRPKKIQLQSHPEIPVLSHVGRHVGGRYDHQGKVAAGNTTSHHAFHSRSVSDVPCTKDGYRRLGGCVSLTTEVVALHGAPVESETHAPGFWLQWK